MDFSLTEEQTLLQESVDRFIQNDYEFDKRQSFANSELGFSEDNWKMFADLGWLGIPFSEADGGFGGGPVDSMLIWEQFGKGLVIEPFLATFFLEGEFYVLLEMPIKKPLIYQASSMGACTRPWRMLNHSQGLI